MLGLTLAICALAAGFFYAASVKAWLLAFKNAVTMSQEGRAFLTQRLKEGVPWMRIAPGMLGGAKTFLVLDADIIDAIYHAPSTDVNASSIHTYFDVLVFGLSKKFLHNKGAYDRAKPQLMRHFAPGPQEHQAQLFSDAIGPQLDHLAGRVERGDTIKLFADVGTDVFASRS
jgi:hypothetical protein